VPAFVKALRDSLGDEGVGTLPERWLPLDSDLTQPGNRPSLSTDQNELPEPSLPPRRRRWPAVALALVLLVVGGLGGWALWQATHRTVSYTDQTGHLSVTVPRAWDRHVDLNGWRPPLSAIAEPGMSIGDRSDWRTSRSGQGVFVGVLPQSALPTTMPQHEGCSAVGKPVLSSQGDPTLTVTSTGCPGVIIEQAQLLTATQLLWVQIRSHSVSSARDVLDSVQTRFF
jgi:hypothetical protein